MKLKIKQLQRIKNIVYEIDCSNCEAMYFDEFKFSLKLRSAENKRSVGNCNCDKDENAKLKKVADRESRLFPRKTEETIHFLKSPTDMS